MDRSSWYAIGLVVLAAQLGVIRPAFSSDAAPELSSICKAGAGESTARLIQARYDGIRDLEAGFTQTNDAATFGGEPLMSPEPKSGHVIFVKPGKMHWSYEKPDKSAVVSNGSLLWIHDVEAKSVTRLTVTAGFLSGAALQFLLGDGQILETFEVQALSCDAGQVRLDLLPKSDATYERLGLVAHPETGDIIETSVLDMFGNLTRIGFTGVKVNQSPDSGLFEFEVPEGVELIEYEGSPAR